MDLKDLARALRTLKGVPEAVAPRAAKEFTSRMKNAYSKQQDPYGVPWKPKAATNKDGGPLLVGESGEMKAGTKGVADGTRVDLVVGHPEVAARHLKGSKRLPRRRPQLDPARGLPRYWFMSLRRFVKQETLKKLGFGGGGKR